MNTFICAAAHYAVFAAPVRPGKHGQALLVSLLLNVSEGDARTDLLLLHRAGVVELIRRESIDLASAERSLRARGVPRDVLDRSHLYDEGSAYTAVAVAAVAATAETVRDHVIYCLRGWSAGRVDDEAAQLRVACAVALGETNGPFTRQTARAFCAQLWNRHAGILC